MSLVGNTPLKKNAMNHHGVKEAFFDTFFQKKATAQLSADAYTHSISENFSRFSFHRQGARRGNWLWVLRCKIYGPRTDDDVAVG